MRIGGVYMYKGKYPVYITAGCFETGGRISNFWDFKKVKPDGTLSQREMGDYDNEHGKFARIKGAKVAIMVTL